MLKLPELKVTPSLSLIGLTTGVREAAAEGLSRILATDFLLLTKVWGYHWNMAGESFNPAHTLFKDLYEGLINDIDDTAERIRALNIRVNGSLSGMMKRSVIADVQDSTKIPTIPQIFKIISSDYDATIKQMREVVAKLDGLNPSDDGSLNYLQDLIMRREKTAWILRSHVV